MPPPTLTALPQPPRKSAEDSTLKRWLFKWESAPVAEVVLSQRRVFILPSRHGIMYASALAVMLVGSINYGLSLGFMLTFLLGALGVNSMFYAFRNLARLRLVPGRSAPVFAGERARFTVIVDNPSALARRGIAISADPEYPAYIDVPAWGGTTVELQMPAPRRGLLRPGRLRLQTLYPLGLCRSWAYAHLDMQCVVYPRPEPEGPPLPAAAGGDAGAAPRSGSDDFAGLRDYRRGDSLRHVAWKAAAREQTLSVKQFSGTASAEVWLEWEATPPKLGTEPRLSRLARWVLEAAAADLSFGLRLPGVMVPPARGPEQRERCLAALAAFDGNRQR